MERLGASWEALGRFLKRLRSVLGASWGVLGVSWEAPGVILESCWSTLGGPRHFQSVSEAIISNIAKPLKIIGK